MSDLLAGKTESQVIFSLEQVYFAYNRDGMRREVLQGVDLSLFPGQKLGLYGPNGSGKTTLFRCITGLEKIQSGRILFRGQLVRGDKDFRRLRRSVGFVLQHAEDQLFFPTVLEDVAFGPLNLGMTAREARRTAEETLDLLGLRDFAFRLSHNLSGGEKKLVSIAAVLAMQPEALLLDEPANGLDQAVRQRLIEIIRGLPMAMIVVSHDWDFLAQISRDYLTIQNGRLLSDAPAVAHSHVHVHPQGNEPHQH